MTATNSPEVSQAAFEALTALGAAVRNGIVTVEKLVALGRAQLLVAGPVDHQAAATTLCFWQACSQEGIDEFWEHRLFGLGLDSCGSVPRFGRCARQVVSTHLLKFFTSSCTS